ncbi:putative ribonuclease H-like domain-containing protein [Tanacetum coccineum]|uniref:Ribonuclease H-like domain-containing protein n=1 Tax=Tanacetum coccineum TaxID=301880 RepID=A0ABQ4WGY5_9ASTR
MENRDDGFFVGYSINSKAFRVLNTRTRFVEENLHINFLENKPNVAITRPNWMFDIDTLTMCMNYQPVFAGNQTNGNAEDEVADDAGKKNGVLDPAKEDDKSGTERAQRNKFESVFGQDKDVNGNSIYRMFTPVNTATSSCDNLGDSIPVNAATLPNANLSIDPPMPDLEDIGIFSSACDDEDVVNAARTSEEHLFEQFSHFKNEFTLPYVPNVFSIDDTGIFGNAYDDEDVGAEADLNNLEKTMNVSPIPTIEIDKDHPKDQIIGDLNSAIQTRRMTKISDEHAMLYPRWIKAMQEELLQFQLPKVFRNKKDERGIVIINKARLVAQGYTQEEGIDYDEVFAPVAKIEAISLFFAYASFIGFIVYQMDVKSAFLYGTIEKEVYVCQPPGFKDPRFPDKVYKVEKALYGLHQAPRAWYETLSTYLIENGFRRGTIDKTLFIKKDKGDILLVQVYVDDIIFGSTKKSFCDEFEDNKHETNKALVKDKEAEAVNVHLYRSMIRSLMYLTASRPDITFAVYACARYLKGQPKLGIWYPIDSPFDLEVFSDSDYAGASLDRKSTTGGCQFLGKRLISWQCKKQTIVANSTTETEYVAAANCCSQNPVFHSKTKHIEIRHHFIRDSYDKKLIQVIKIHTGHNVADLLTKAFDVSRFNFLIASIGLLNL